MNRSTTLIALLAAVIALPGAAAASGPVLSQVRGRVEVVGAGGGAGRPALPLQTLAAGTVLRLAGGAEAVVICPDDRALELNGPAEWRAEAGGCAAGRPLAAGSHALLMPAAGRAVSFSGALLEEAPSRGEDAAGKVPDLLFPRGPQRLAVAIADPRPDVAWSEVTGALEYELVLQGGGRGTAVQAVRGDCLPDRRTAPVRVCSAAWPWPPLEPGEEVALRVRARTADPDWPVREADASLLRLAAAEVRGEVESRLAALAEGTLPDATRELLRAAVYARARLYNEAAAALAASLEDRPQAAVAVGLGDLYLGLGAQRAALAEYRRTEQLLPPRGGDDGVRAALHLGLGRLYARRAERETAVHHLQEAAKLYQRLGRDADAGAAEAEAERAGRDLS